MVAAMVAYLAFMVALTCLVYSIFDWTHVGSPW